MIFMALLDYLCIIIASSCMLTFVLVSWSKFVTARPLPARKPSTKNVKTLLVPYKLHSTTLTAHVAWLFIFISSFSLLVMTQSYERLYTSSQINTTEYYWFYLTFCAALLGCSWYIITARAELERVIHEHTITLFIIMSSIQAYLLVTNLWALTILLEIQGIALILLIDVDQLFRKAALRQTAAATRNLQNTKVANALLIQFWVGFLGAAALLLAGGFCIQLTGATHWQDLATLLVLRQTTGHHDAPALSVLSLLLVSLLLKTGAVPLHFWKPELYVSLRLSNVFVYAVPYSGAVAMLVILVIHILMLATPNLLVFLLWALALLATYILLPLLSSVTEIKAFLAYTAGLHIAYIYVAPTADRLNAASATLYNISYLLATMLIFSALLAFKHVSIKYLTDLQIYSQLPHKVFLMSTALATMAGIPPLLGFWAKFNILYSLWNASGSIVAIHLLSISMVYLYFYIALYRFTGATNFKVHPRRTRLMRRTTLLTIGTLISALQLTGLWHVADLSNWAILFAQHLHAYH